jgi:hypothetical protein
MVRTGASQAEIGQTANVRQPQVSNFLRGRTKTVTAEIRRLCQVAKIRIDGIDRDEATQRLALASRRAWDGRPETLDGLIAFIEWVGPRYCSGLAPSSGKAAKRR